MKLDWIQSTLPNTHGKGKIGIPIFYVTVEHRVIVRIELDWDSKKHCFKNLWLIEILGKNSPSVIGIRNDEEDIKLIAEHRLQETINSIQELLK